MAIDVSAVLSDLKGLGVIDAGATPKSVLPIRDRLLVRGGFGATRDDLVQAVMTITTAIGDSAAARSPGAHSAESDKIISDSVADAMTDLLQPVIAQLARTRISSLAQPKRLSIASALSGPSPSTRRVPMDLFGSSSASAAPAPGPAIPPWLWYVAGGVGVVWLVTRAS